MLDLDFFRNRTFNAGNVIAFLVTFSMFATFFFITLYMQDSPWASRRLRPACASCR